VVKGAAIAFFRMLVCVGIAVLSETQLSSGAVQTTLVVLFGGIALVMAAVGLLITWEYQFVRKWRKLKCPYCDKAYNISLFAEARIEYLPRSPARYRRFVLTCTACGKEGLVDNSWPKSWAEKALPRESMGTGADPWINNNG